VVATPTVYRLAAGTSVEDAPARVRLVRGGLAATIESTPGNVGSLIAQLASGGVTATDLDGASAEILYVLAALEQRGLLAASVPGLLDVEPLRSAVRVIGAIAPLSPRLSRFAVLHEERGALTLESPLGAGWATLTGRRGAALAGALAAGEGALDDGERAAVALLGAAGLLAGEREQSVRARAWEWHDLLFHAETRGWSDGRPRGGTFHLRGLVDPPPDARPPHSGPVIELERDGASADMPLRAVVERRRSERRFADERPVTVAELGRLLDRAAARRAVFEGDGIELSRRPAPSGGALAALELYPNVRLCTGLDAGLYHYEADTHRLRLIGPAPDRFPGDGAQVALVVSLRHARIAWKYERIAYQLALIDLGVLYQTLWLTATAMGLGGFPLGSVDAAVFARATGLDPLDETGFGAFLLGRPEAA
jgi:SagB-type dehydrogenase family enzyme